MTTSLEPVDTLNRRYLLPPSTRTIARTMDAGRLNALANDPAVRPWLGGDGPLDLTALVRQPQHIALVSTHGGALFLALGDGRYEVHSMFLPDGRGREAVGAMREALDYLFARTPAVEIVTKVPAANVAAAWLARLGGFAHLFTAAATWTPTARVEMTHLSLSLDSWALRSTRAGEMGRWFHDAMTDALKGSTLPPHSDEDGAHDQMAGAAGLMIAAGQARKAEAFYNRYAAWTGFSPMRLVSEAPVVIEMDGVLVEAAAEGMEILACP